MAGWSWAFYLVGIESRAEARGGGDGFGIGVKQDFLGVIEQSRVGVPWPVGAETIELAGSHAGDVAVPDAAKGTSQLPPGFVENRVSVAVALSGVFQQAQFHRRGLVGVDRKSRTVGGQVGAQQIRVGFRFRGQRRAGVGGDLRGFGVVAAVHHRLAHKIPPELCFFLEQPDLVYLD